MVEFLGTPGRENTERLVIPDSHSDICGLLY